MSCTPLVTVTSTSSPRQLFFSTHFTSAGRDNGCNYSNSVAVTFISMTMSLNTKISRTTTNKITVYPYRTTATEDVEKLSNSIHFPSNQVV